MRWSRSRSPSTRRARDRGAATVFVLAIGCVVVWMGAAFAIVGTARVARHQAQVAADLGALAGAAHAVEGPGVACAVAARYVEANAGVMTSCAVEGLDIVIRVEVALTAMPGPTRHAYGAARAGPVSASLSG